MKANHWTSHWRCIGYMSILYTKPRITARNVEAVGISHCKTLRLLRFVPGQELSRLCSEGSENLLCGYNQITELNLHNASKRSFKVSIRWPPHTKKGAHGKQ